MSVSRILLIVALLLSVLITSAEYLMPSSAQSDNGILLGPPKVYDNRALAIMLDQLNDSLQNVKIVDQEKLEDNIGLTQGYQSREVLRSFDISTLPQPAVKTIRKPDDAGQLSITEETTDRSAVSPQRATLPQPLSPPTYAPKYGIDAGDLLSEQVNLTYQIFNLRMLLERSLSDRLLRTGTSFKPKLQAVLGFPISITPSNESKDSAAFVEITIAQPIGGARISLVSLMPQEKTYNAVALNSKSNAFGGSAIARACC